MNMPDKSLKEQLIESIQNRLCSINGLTREKELSLETYRRIRVQVGFALEQLDILKGQLGEVDE